MVRLQHCHFNFGQAVEQNAEDGLGAGRDFKNSMEILKYIWLAKFGGIQTPAT